MLNPLKYALSTLPSTTSHRTGIWKNCCSRIYVTIFVGRIGTKRDVGSETSKYRFELSCSSDLRLKLESKREGDFDVARYSIFNTTNVHVSGVSCINDYHKLIRRDIKTIVEINKLYTHLYTFELAWKNITLTYGMK